MKKRFTIALAIASIAAASQSFAAVQTIDVKAQVYLLDSNSSFSLSGKRLSNSYMASVKSISSTQVEAKLKTDDSDAYFNVMRHLGNRDIPVCMVHISDMGINNYSMTIENVNPMYHCKETFSVTQPSGVGHPVSLGYYGIGAYALPTA